MQMALLQNEFCYFYVWSKNETCKIKIERDVTFWNENSQKAIIYIENIIIPELMACYYTKNHDKNNDQ